MARNVGDRILEPYTQTSTSHEDHCTCTCIERDAVYAATIPGV